MKYRKTTFICICGLLFLDSFTAFAFHTMGVNECDVCHNISNQELNDLPSGLSTLGAEPQTTSSMLRWPDATSTCLSCHAKNHNVFSLDGSAFTPGGDFFWLTRSYNDRDGRSTGDSHGHNVIAREAGLYQDPLLAVAPSDGSVSYQASWLGCTSCHDPHAKISSGNYRLLGGVGYNGGGQAEGIRFTNPAPVAKSYSTEGDQWPAETDRNHTDYGSGMSEWCANCHSGFSGPGQHSHVSGNDARLKILATFYNNYRATADMSGDRESAYDHFVPFERSQTDPARLDPSSTEGPGGTATVMCLTCHRAHASPFADIGRWDFQATLLAESPVFSLPEGKNAYYGENIPERYQQFQRSLCNKCHVQD